LALQTGRRFRVGTETRLVDHAAAFEA